MKKTIKTIVPTHGFRRVVSIDMGITNFSIGVVTLNGDNDFDIEYLQCVNVVEKAGSRIQNVKRIKMEILVTYFLNFLHSVTNEILKNRPDAIVIEQQPTRTGSHKIRGISHVVQSFFYLHYKLRGEEPPPIVYQNGLQKLRIEVATDKLINPTNLTSRSSKGQNPTNAQRWTQNKKQAKYQFEAFLHFYPKCGQKWFPFYRALKKKDDVADVVLQAIFLLVVGNPITSRSNSGPVALPGDPTVNLSFSPLENCESDDDQNESDIEHTDSWMSCSEESETEEIIDLTSPKKRKIV